MKNKMRTYSHVGRPTNQEVKNHIIKKKIKSIGIMASIIIIIGAIFLYVNKDKLELAGIMGNSTNNTMLNIQNNKDYRTLNFKADAYDGKYLYQRYAESGNKKLITYIYEKLGYGDTKKYKAKAIKFYYNGKLLADSKAYAKSNYIRLHKSTYGKNLSAIVYAQNLKTNKLEKKAIRIVVVKTDPFVGKKYKLTDAQIKSIAALAYNETGTIRGTIFEAAFMANRFELFPNGYKDIYSFIRNSEYWYNSKKIMDNTGKVDARLIDGVKNVLINGYRPMPQYIDEHDCVKCGDVTKIIYNGKNYTKQSDILDSKYYIKGKTTIYNSYNTYYTHYGFPVPGKDVYGYTTEAFARYKKLNNS